MDHPHQDRQYGNSFSASTISISLSHQAIQGYCYQCQLSRHQIFLQEVVVQPIRNVVQKLSRTEQRREGVWLPTCGLYCYNYQRKKHNNYRREKHNYYWREKQVGISPFYCLWPFISPCFAAHRFCGRWRCFKPIASWPCTMYMVIFWGKKAALLSSSSWVKSKNLEKSKFENAGLFLKNFQVKILILRRRKSIFATLSQTQLLTGNISCLLHHCQNKYTIYAL